MKRPFEHSGHFVRLGGVLLVAVGAFLVIRAAVVPKAFGLYGHYRPGALNDIRARKVSFAGQTECVMCHDAEASVRNTGKHKSVSCEACHGPLARHAEDPSANRPVLPNVAVLCARCHEKDAAKPKAFPQVVTREHSQGVACNTCHKPHQPKP